MNKYNFCVYIRLFKKHSWYFISFKGDLIQNKSKTANDKKNNSNNKFMFVISNPKGTHL